MKFDPHDKNQVEEKELKSRDSERRNADDLRWVLSTKQGRRFLWRLLGFCGVFRISFTGNSHTFFNEGQRNVGLRFFNEILSADEQAFVQMRKEASEGLDDNG